MAKARTKGFRLVEGSWIFVPGGVVHKTIKHHSLPSDSPELKVIAQTFGVPEAEIRKAFGTLPATSVAPSPPPPAPAPVAEDADAEAGEPVEAEEEAPAPKKKKKKKIRHEE